MRTKQNTRPRLLHCPHLWRNAPARQLTDCCVPGRCGTGNECIENCMVAGAQCSFRCMCRQMRWRLEDAISYIHVSMASLCEVPRFLKKHPPIDAHGRAPRCTPPGRCMRGLSPTMSPCQLILILRAQMRYCKTVWTCPRQKICRRATNNDTPGLVAPRAFS